MIKVEQVFTDWEDIDRSFCSFNGLLRILELYQVNIIENNNIELILNDRTKYNYSMSITFPNIDDAIKNMKDGTFMGVYFSEYTPDLINIASFLIDFKKENNL